MNFSTPVGPLLPLSAARSSNSSRASRARAVGRGGVSLLFALAVGLAASDAAAQSVAADGAGRVTFAHPFRAGHCSGSVTVAGVPTETVVMRRHPDGSVRHAVLTADFPAAGSYALTCGGGDGAPAIATPAVQVEIGSLGTVAASGAGEAFGMERRWTGVAGPILVLIDARADGQLSVTGEHTWHDTPSDPRGTTVASYDLTIRVGGAVVYQRAGLRHHTHTRWRVVLDDQPGPHVRFDSAYLAATRAVPPYDTAKVPSPATVSATAWLDPARQYWASTPHDPLTEEYGTTNPSFIGADEGSPLSPPQALFVTSGEPLPWQRSLEAANFAGNFAMHVRDRATGDVLSIDDRPTFNQDRAILYPEVRNAAGAVVSRVDAAHQPSLAFLPYLLTGDRYYWEELEFWVLYNWLERPVTSGPSWTGRNGSEGILWTGQVRSVAWGMRTLVHAAWVAPERAAYYEQKLANNFAWMNARFPQPGGPPVGDSDGYSPLGNTTKREIPSDNASYRPSYLPWAADSCAYDTQAWNHAILGWSLDYAYRLGYTGGSPMRNHVLKPILGLGAVNPYDFWLHHLCVANGDGAIFPDYAVVHQVNTAKRPTAASAANTYWGWGGASSGYKQWARGGLVAAVNAGLPGARALFDRVEPEFRAWWVDTAEWNSPEWLILPADDAPTAPPPPPPPPSPTAPAAPSATAARAVAQTAVDLTWKDNSTNEVGFRVEMATAGGAFGEILTTAAGVQLVRVSGLRAGTAYSFRVRAHNAVGASAFSNVAAVTTPVEDPPPPPPPPPVSTIPAAPVSLQGQPASPTTVDLRWQDMTSVETGFVVQMAPAGGAWSDVATAGVNVTEARVAGLQPASAYSFRVRAFNSSGMSNASNTLAVTTPAADTAPPPPPATAPPPPAALKFQATGDTRARLTWSAGGSPAGGFVLEMSADGGAFRTVATPAPDDRIARVDKLSPQTFYAFRIKACNAAGCSAYSNTVKLPPRKARKPKAPTAVRVALDPPDIALVQWSPALQAARYRVEMKAGSGKAGRFREVATRGARERSVAVNLRSPGQAYFFRVQACNARGCSEYSKPVRVIAPKR